MKKHLLLATFIFFLLTLSAYSVVHGFKTSDLQGNWHAFGTEINPNIPAVYWLYGDIDIDASGNITSGIYYLPDDSSVELTSGQLAVDPQGIITGSFEAGATQSATVVNGKIDQGKTMGASVIIGTDGSMDFTTMIKGGGAFTSTDLQSRWYAYVTIIDATTGAVYWAYGILSIDGSGKITGTFDGADGSTLSVTSGAAAIDSEGMITGSFKLSSGLTVLISHGKMDQGKTFGVFVGVTPDGSMGNVYLVKAGGTFRQQDGAGNWYAYGIFIDPSIPAVAWVYGEARIAASGNLKGFYILPTEDEIGVTGVTTMDSDGESTATLTLTTGNTAISPSTKLDQGKTNMVGVTIDPNSFAMGFWQFFKGYSGGLIGPQLLLLGD
jgi:hypothetical protein